MALAPPTGDFGGGNVSDFLCALPGMTQQPRCRRRLPAPPNHPLIWVVLEDWCAVQLGRRDRRTQGRSAVGPHYALRRLADYSQCLWPDAQ